MKLLRYAYCSLSNLEPLVGEISWAKNVLVFKRCKDLLPSPEAIAERLRLWGAESAQQAADDRAEGAE